MADSSQIARRPNPSKVAGLSGPGRWSSSCRRWLFQGEWTHSLNSPGVPGTSHCPTSSRTDKVELRQEVAFRQMHCVRLPGPAGAHCLTQRVAGSDQPDTRPEELPIRRMRVGIDTGKTRGLDPTNAVGCQRIEIHNWRHGAWLARAVELYLDGQICRAETRTGE